MKNSSVAFSFTSQLANLKSTLTLWEDVVTKAVKLSVSLRSVVQCIAGFLEAFQRVADSAYGSNCGLRELGSCMTRFCLRERGLESRLRMFNSQLLDCLASPLGDRLEEWRRTVAQLDRENNKEWRRARSELQRVSCEVDKLNKRFRRKGSVPLHSEHFGGINTGNSHLGDNVQLNFVQHDLELKQRTLADLERTSLRRAVVEERRRFAEMITCLKPVLDSQVALLNELKSIDECAASITKHTFDPNDLPSDTEQAIDEAVDQVASKPPIQVRKLSDVRAAGRFGRNLSAFEHPNSSHTSQLSLQSAISGSTTTSWGVIATAAASTTLVGTRPTSPSSVSHAPRSTAMGTQGVCAYTGDVLSLFEANGSLSDPISVGSQRPYATEGAVPNSMPNHVLSASAVPTDNRCAVASQESRNDDEEEFEDTGADGGGTTEDTEDGETEDEEHLRSSNAPEATQPLSILYPNQAIPAPVYTNLNELKRAAARKFGMMTTPEAQTHQRDAHFADAMSHSTDPEFLATMPSNASSVPHEPMSDVNVSSDCASQSYGLISTCMASGTSTFRRKQAEPGSRHTASHEITNGSVMHDGVHRPFIYGSITPALTRRAGQACSEAVDHHMNGRSRSRPVHPPRRSSSVSRELSRLRLSSGDQYTSGYVSRNPVDVNGADPGIQRVSSSIFSQSDLDRVHRSALSHRGNGPLGLMEIPHGLAPPATTANVQYASVSVASGYASDIARSERLTALPRFTPPPLATVPAPSLSKTNQLLFGVKVLPNPTVSPVSGMHYNRPAQRSQMHRQTSCDAANYASPSSSASSHPNEIALHPPQPRRPVNVVRDDAVTSFID